MEGGCQSRSFLVGENVNLADSRGAEGLPGRTWPMKLDAGRELGVMRAQCGGQMVADDEQYWGLLRSLDGRLKTMGNPRTEFKDITVPPRCPPATQFPSLLVTTVAQG